MRLVIAEKPSMGREIAQALGIAKAGKSFIECENNTLVTWCYGHMYEQAPPDFYLQSVPKGQKQYWKIEDLPIVPMQWKLLPKKEASEQISVIKSLLTKCDSIIHAGDPDREGQLLVDELLQELGNKKEVKRIILNDLSTPTIQKALSTLKNNEEFTPLSLAALARSRVDWLIGMNLTRAFTLAYNKNSGVHQLLSYGRVQTPTLSLVVERDCLIKNFVSKDFFKPVITVEHKNGTFTANMVITKDTEGLDGEGYLVDSHIAQCIVKNALEKMGNVIEANYKKKEKNPPLPYDLSSIQKAASAKFGFSAQETLDIMQSLYEKKLTSYPRTDCRYLPEEQYNDSKGIIKMLQDIGITGASNTISRKSPAWDSSKLSAHHGLMPVLGGKPQGLSADETKLYTLVAESYIMQFFPNMVYEDREIVLIVNEKKWTAKGKKILSPGWTQLDSDDEPEDLVSIPDNIKSQDSVKVVNAEGKTGKTTPPPYFTEGSLIDAMEHVARFIEDPALKAKLNETSGIGTPATRANIIETLKSRKFIEAKGSKLVSTPLGQAFIQIIPNQLKSAGMTALWEQKLTEIEKGQYDLEKFMEMQEQALPQYLRLALNADYSKAVPTSSSKSTNKKCPECGYEMKKFKSKKNGKMYWGCFNDKHTDTKTKFIEV